MSVAVLSAPNDEPLMQQCAPDHPARMCQQYLKSTLCSQTFLIEVHFGVCKAPRYKGIQRGLLTSRAVQMHRLYG
jgi:hypothetical protein